MKTNTYWIDHGEGNLTCVVDSSGDDEDLRVTREHFALLWLLSGLKILDFQKYYDQFWEVRIKVRL
jgi:hypothetical protein